MEIEEMGKGWEKKMVQQKKRVNEVEVSKQEYKLCGVYDTRIVFRDFLKSWYSIYS